MDESSIAKKKMVNNKKKMMSMPKKDMESMVKMIKTPMLGKMMKTQMYHDLQVYNALKGRARSK